MLSAGNTQRVSIRVASTLWERLVGLLGTSADGFDFDALLITPCSSVHTVGMRYPIDIVFLDRDMRTLKVEFNVKPGRLLVACPGAKSVLEFPRDCNKAFLDRHAMPDRFGFPLETSSSN